MPKPVTIHEIVIFAFLYNHLGWQKQTADNSGSM